MNLVEIKKIENLFQNEEQQNDVVYEFLEVLCEKLKLNAIKIQNNFSCAEGDTDIYYISEKYDHPLAGQLAKGYPDLPLVEYNQRKYLKKRMYADIMKNIEKQIEKTLAQMEKNETCFKAMERALKELK
jgi:hypothetical protein